MARGSLAVRRGEPFAGGLTGSVLPVLLAGVLALLCGLAIAYGSIFGWLFVAAVTGVALFPLFTEYRVQALIAWAALSCAAYPFLRYPVGGGSLVTFDRVWLALLFAGSLVVALDHRRSRPSKLMVWTLSLLVCTYLVRAITTQGHALSDTRIWLDAIALPTALFVAGSRLLTTKERVIKLCGGLAAAGAVLAVFGIAEWLTGFTLAPRSGGQEFFDAAIGTVRVSGPFSGPETYALSLVLCLAGALYWVQARRGLTFAVGAIPIGLILAAIGISFFRAAWLAALVVVIAAFGVRPKRFARLIGILGVILVLVALAATQVESGKGSAAGGGSAVSERLSDTNNVNGRLATYRAEFEIFKSAPLFGIGIERFNEVAKSNVAVSFGGVKQLQYPHSSYLGTLVEQGLFGFLPLIGVTFAVWWLLRAFRKRARDREDVLLLACVGGAAVGYLLMSLTLTLIPFGPSNALLLVMLAAVAARLDVLRRSPEPEPRPA